MKIKRFLRFYFSAGSLNAALDRLIFKLAMDAAAGAFGCESYFEKIAKIIEAKGELKKLWGYLHSKIGSLPEEDVRALRYYASLRVGLKNVDGDRRAAVHRAVVKLSRRLKSSISFVLRLYPVLAAYYCLIDCLPDVWGAP